MCKAISIKLSKEEMSALLTFAENQIFREKFINPKLPGYKTLPEELSHAQAAVAVLKNALQDEKGKPEQTNGGFANPAKRPLSPMRG